MAEAPDFWLTSGYHLLALDGDGRLAVTDDWLRAYLRRPELAPVAESCAAERALHEALLAAPRRPVGAERLAALADPDAGESYRIFLAFRDHVVAHGTIEAAYAALFRAGSVAFPPLFLDQMVHAVLRSLLGRRGDPLEARAGELLFRAQKVTLLDSGVMLADEDTVEMYAKTGGFGDLGRLVVEAGTALRSIDLEVLDPEAAEAYWPRSDRFDTVLDLAFARPGLDALCRVLEAWVAHFHDVTVSIQPVQQVSDERWRWHVGLDATATAILNDLYEGREVGEDRLASLIALFRLEFADPAVMLPSVAGRPVYLGLAMNEAKVVRLKPQNLLVNLPLQTAA